MNPELKNTPIYIIHAIKGYEKHEARLTKIFNEIKLDYEFITEGDVSKINQEILNKYFDFNITTTLSKGVLSCTLNHVLAYEKLVSNGHKYALIFENDPFFIGDFKKSFAKLYAEMETLKGSFIISLENSTLRFPSIWDMQSNKQLYLAKSGRMAGAYIINLEAAKNILNDLKSNKCSTVIDWWHNELIERNVINMYWLQPTIVEQGSHNGHLSSTISTKPSSLGQKIRWKIKKHFKYYIVRLLPNDFLV